MRADSDRSRGNAFTLVEVLAVIAIIGVVLALLLPAIMSARESSRRAQCLSNLKQPALAAYNYHSAMRRFPVGLIAIDRVAGTFSGGTNLWVEMLPYLEESSLKQKWDYKDYRNNIGKRPNAVAAHVLAFLLCPSDALPAPAHELVLPAPWEWLNGPYALSSYGGNAGVRSFGYDGVPQTRDGVFFKKSRVRFGDITDGTSKTFLFGERSHHDPEYDRLTREFDPNFGPLASWGAWAGAYHEYGSQGDVLLGSIVPINYMVPPLIDPGNWDWEDFRLSAFGSEHAGGANFAFADGSVRFVADTIAHELLQALSTRAGGELAQPP